MFAECRSCSLALALLLTSPFIATAARADADGRALATALFKEGRRLLDVGRVAEACEKLSESQRLDPGGGTLLNLAACHERLGRTATSWAEFTEALAQARRDGRDDRARVAADRIAALEPRLATLRIEVDAANADTLEVRLDGGGVGRAAWGVAVPVDPGEHVVEASGPGKRDWFARVSAAEGRAASAHVPVLDDERVALPAPAAPPPPRGPAVPLVASARPGGVSERQGGVSARDALTVGAAAVGVAGVVIGATFGAKALSRRSASEEACPAGRCTRMGASLARDAASAADVSTASFTVAAGALGAAVVLYLTRPRHPTLENVAIEVAPQRAWAGWRAAF